MIFEKCLRVTIFSDVFFSSDFGGGDFWRVGSTLRENTKDWYQVSEALPIIKSVQGWAMSEISGFLRRSCRPRVFRKQKYSAKDRNINLLEGWVPVC
jgi:hypothetical protein